jgi:endonuclease/exonuclease/phosphatase family metal-dependent hydrolase
VPSDLDVLTVNLWGLPWPVSRERRVRKRRLAVHLARRVYDIVGIQELWWPWRRTLELASLVLPETRRDSGLALAGRLPSLGAAVEHFEHGAGIDRLKRKGVLRANVEAPGGEPLSVWVVHLQAGRRHAAVRTRQVDALAASLAREPRPVVLMGDFNFHEGCAEDRRSAERLLAGGLADAALALEREHPTYHARSNRYARRDGAHRFDRVYLRDGAGLRLRPLAADVLDLGPHAVSDHHPLRVRVRISG